MTATTTDTTPATTAANDPDAAELARIQVAWTETMRLYSAARESHRRALVSGAEATAALAKSGLDLAQSASDALALHASMTALDLLLGGGSDLASVATTPATPEPSSPAPPTGG